MAEVSCRPYDSVSHIQNPQKAEIVISGVGGPLVLLYLRLRIGRCEYDDGVDAGWGIVKGDGYMKRL
jgi:hypothetical protein